MTVVRVKVDKETRRRMALLRDVNWSEVVRDAIGKRLEEEGTRDFTGALLSNDRLARAAPAGWDSVEAIRHWREGRQS